MEFTKMHGAGNDYVYVDCTRHPLSCPEQWAKSISDRHFGVGSDGLVLILPSAVADFRMRMFNADGSEAQMCGNASRCVGKYVYDNGLTDKTEISLETKAGIKKLNLAISDGKVSSVCVDMGEPVLDPCRIPVALSAKDAVAVPIELCGTTYTMTCVSMGNPHAVIFVPSLGAIDVHALGPVAECHPLFPERCNIEFAEVLSPERIAMRVWERGAGETLACGTGACATLVAAVLNHLTKRKARLELLGGNLDIEWGDDHHVYMTGGAVTVFKGEWLL